MSVSEGNPGARSGAHGASATMPEAIGDPAPMHLHYDAACRALAKARSVDEVHDFRNRAEALRAYARQAKNRQLELDAAEIRFRAERRLGELIAAQRQGEKLSRGGRPSATGMKTNPVSAAPSLAEVGIDKNLAHRARQYAAIPETEFQTRLVGYREAIEREGARTRADLLALGSSSRHARVTCNTGAFEWYTPASYIDLARDVLGGIDLDPASCATANAVVRAKRFFSLDNDGLQEPWSGRVWMNPPYAQPAISHFCDKVVRDFEAGQVSAAIILTNDCTDTVWFHQLAAASAALCFTRGRIRFVSPRGESGSPTQGQTFFYLGRDGARFAQVFRTIGLVVEVRG